MECRGCKSERVARVKGKTDDKCFISIGGKELDDYVPRDMGIGGGDYIEFSYCLDCGLIQGEFPLEETGLEEKEDEDEDEEDEDL